MHRLIWIQTVIGLDSNQSGNGRYNLISVLFNKISLCTSEGVQLSERRASLGIMGEHARDIFKPLGPSQHSQIEGFKGDP